MISLVRSSKSVRLLTCSTCLSKAFWAWSSRSLAASSADLVWCWSSSLNLLVWASSVEQRAVLGPLLAQGDERLVAGQHVDAVEHEGDVVEIEVLDLLPPELEELLGDQVEVGDGDHLDGRRLVVLLGFVLLRGVFLGGIGSLSADLSTGAGPVSRAARV